MKPEILLPAPKPVEEPTYPNTNLQVSPQGVRIAIGLAPGIELSTTLNEETINQLMTLWLQTRKAVAQEMALIKDIKQSRND
jgi:hypothetical protein